MFLENLKSAIEDEYKAHYLYKSMISLTNDAMWQSFIASVMEDEKSHYEMLQQLHYMMTGQFVSMEMEKPTCIHLKECLKVAIADELETSKKYRLMYLNVPIEAGRIPLFIAMHDELEHAVRLSTIYQSL